MCELLKPRRAKSYIGLNCTSPATVDALLPTLLGAVADAPHISGVVL